MKFFKVLIPLLLVALFAVWYAPFNKSCRTIRENSLRLHVVARSDSEDDQRVKLLVRDAVLEVMSGASESNDKTGAEAKARALLSEAVSAANRVLRKNGFDYSASAYITEMYFPISRYGVATLPAGDYTALRVELGNGAGANWWCVIYPQLCLLAASDIEEEARNAYGDEAAQVVIAGERYEVRWKICELFSQIRNFFTQNSRFEGDKTDSASVGD